MIRFVEICLHWTCFFIHPYCKNLHSEHFTNVSVIFSLTFSHRGLLRFFFSLYSIKPQGRNLKCQIAIQHFFKIVLYRCLDLIRHNIDTHLKHNKYIFDIPIPFCHDLYLSATLKQFLTEFAARYNCLHHVYMSIPGRIPTCDLILWSVIFRQCVNTSLLS